MHVDAHVVDSFGKESVCVILGSNASSWPLLTHKDSFLFFLPPSISHSELGFGESLGGS